MRAPRPFARNTRISGSLASDPIAEFLLQLHVSTVSVSREARMVGIDHPLQIVRVAMAMSRSAVVSALNPRPWNN